MIRGPPKITKLYRFLLKAPAGETGRGYSRTSPTLRTR